MEIKKVCCWQTDKTLSGTKGKLGQTLCGRNIDVFFGSSAQMGLVAPLDALGEPSRITCEACREKLPQLHKAVEDERCDSTFFGQRCHGEKGHPFSHWSSQTHRIDRDGNRVDETKRRG